MNWKIFLAILLDGIFVLSIVLNTVLIIKLSSITENYKNLIYKVNNLERELDVKDYIISGDIADEN